MSRCGERSLTPKLSDAAPVAAMLAAESAEQAAWVTLGRRSLERLVRLVPSLKERANEGCLKRRCRPWSRAETVDAESMDCGERHTEKALGRSVVQVVCPIQWFWNG